MPFYDYKCGQCGKTFEVIHGMNAKPQGIKCEFCESADIQRVFTPINTLGGEHSGSGACSSCSTGGCGSCSCK